MIFTESAEGIDPGFAKVLTFLDLWQEVRPQMLRHWQDETFRRLGAKADKRRRQKRAIADAVASITRPASDAE